MFHSYFEGTIPYIKLIIFCTYKLFLSLCFKYFFVVVIAFFLFFLLLFLLLLLFFLSFCFVCLFELCLYVCSFQINWTNQEHILNLVFSPIIGKTIMYRYRP